MSIDKNIKYNQIIVILGPTASGKTKTAVLLARKFQGEIVSADSRQVYKGMDVGTGKDLKQYIVSKKQKSKKAKKQFAKIPYYLIDVVSPKTEFSLAKYQRLAYMAVDDILKRGKLPILVGGSGLYLQSVVDGYALPASKPDKKLRNKLEKMSAEKLFKMLKKLDFKKANCLNEGDRKNKRRLIRHIEIAKSGRTALKAVRPLERNYDFLVIGIKRDMGEIRKRIYKRLVERLEKEDMVGEVKRLRKGGVSWKKLESFGLEYKFISLYLRKKLNYEEMTEKLNIAIGQFAKRQMSWFRRWERQEKKIYWSKSYRKTSQLINNFLK